VNCRHCRAAIAGCEGPARAEAAILARLILVSMFFASMSVTYKGRFRWLKSHKAVVNSLHIRALLNEICLSGGNNLEVEVLSHAIL